MKRIVISSLICIFFIASCSKKEDFLEDRVSTLTIYPNPISEGGVFYINSNSSLDRTIRIINKFGEEFYYQDVNSVGSMNIMIATEGFPPNIYFVECETSNGLLRKELIISESPF